MNDVYQTEAEWCYERAICLINNYVPDNRYTYWSLAAATDWLDRAEDWLDRKED